jgi:hypothetical protein
MKFLLIILSLLSFSFSQLLPSDEDLMKMSYSDKLMVYNSEKKSPMWAMVWQVVPTASYAYINNWKRGVKFLGLETSMVILGKYIRDETRFSNESKGKSMATVCYSIAGLLKLYEYVDLYKQTNKYNERLHNKIFQKDNNLSFLILPTSNGAYLNLSYNF